jgi:hypothetical protein
VLEMHPAPPYARAPLHVVLPHTMLQVAFENGGGFKEFLIRRHDQFPSSPEHPWGLVLYGDAVEPGMALAAIHNRKVWMFYYSFREFGPLALANDEMWFTISAKRAVDVPHVQDGISQIVAAICKAIWCGDFDPRKVGIDLYNHRDGSSITIYVSLYGFLMDGEAHKFMWGVKGYAAMRICTLCLNIYASWSRINEEDGTEGIVCSITDLANLVYATREQIYGTVDRLAARCLTDAPHTFELRQRAVGFNHLPRGILLDPELRDLVDPTTHFIHDPQHVLFVDGVVNMCTFLVLEALFHAGWTTVYTAIFVFLQGMRWPRKFRDLSDVFSPKRVALWREAGHVKCQASEMLGLYPAIAYFLMRFSNGMCALQVRAFLLMADMVDAIMLVPTGGATVGEVRDRVRLFLRSCHAAGWDEYMKPKFHWLVHVIGDLSCFTLERKHKLPKAYALLTRDTTVFDHAILGEVVCHHMAVLEQPDFGSCSIGLVRGGHAATRAQIDFMKESLGLADDVPDERFKSGHEARYGAGGTCQVHDVVLMQHPHGGRHVQCGEVWAHIQMGRQCCSIISRWAFESWDSNGGVAKYVERHQPEIWPTEDIVGAVMHRRYTDVVVVILPPNLR